jgi:ATP-dependent protease ClpP protease subunit
MNQILIENKAGKIQLRDIVMQPVMDELIAEIGRIFGAKAAAEGSFTGELTNYAENAVDTLEIVIHSPGGSVLDGYTLFHEINALRARGVVVTATINSLAASMASVIAMACDSIRMVPQGRMMIHEVKQGIYGDTAALTAGAKLCDDMSAEIADIYASKTGQTSSSMREMMKKETWMNAKEALAAGFIDEVFDIRATETTKNTMSLLSKLFPGNDEISKLEASINENDSLRTELATAQLKITELTGLSAIIADKDLEITALATEKQDLTTALATATEEIAAKVTEIEAAKASAGVIATEILASIGQPAPLAIEGELPPVDHAAIYATLTGAARTNYYTEHSADIRKSITK